MIGFDIPLESRRQLDYAVRDGAELLVKLADTGTGTDKFWMARKLLEERERQGLSASSLEIFEILEKTPGVMPGTLSKAWLIMLHGFMPESEKAATPLPIEQRLFGMRQAGIAAQGDGLTLAERMRRRGVNVVAVTPPEITQYEEQRKTRANEGEVNPQSEAAGPGRPTPHGPPGSYQGGTSQLSTGEDYRTEVLRTVDEIPILTGLSAHPSVRPLDQEDTETVKAPDQAAGRASTPTPAEAKRDEKPGTPEERATGLAPTSKPGEGAKVDEKAKEGAAAKVEGAGGPKVEGGPGVSPPNLPTTTNKPGPSKPTPPKPR